MKPVRGQAAFSLSVDPSGDSVHMRAELLLGAQTGRNDRLIFDRATQVVTRHGTFKGKLKVILEPRFANKYLKNLERVDGGVQLIDVSATVANGRLDIHFASAAANRKRWTEARSGNEYLVANFWLGIGDDFASLHARTLPGPSALISATLILQV